jgi:hypothetical protein
MPSTTGDPGWCSRHRCDMKEFCWQCLADECAEHITADRTRIADLEEELRQARDWEDVDDEWTAEIDAAHPTRGGSHEDYATAMKMVGHRHSNGELVALVCWLLSKTRKPSTR